MFKAIVVAIIALFGLSACNTAASETGGKESIPSISKEEVYVTIIKDKFPEFKYMTDSEVIKHGKDLCDIFEVGAPHSESEMGELLLIYTDSISDLFTTQEAIDYLAQTSVAFCPNLT